MKMPLTIIVLVLLTACSSKKDPDVMSLTQAWLKEQMKDPASFQVIKSTILDTTMMSRFLQDRYKEDTAMITRTIIENKLDADAQFIGEGQTEERVKYEKLLEKKTDIYRESAKKGLQELQDLKTDRIFYVAIRIDYRAKNSFGALGAESKTINYYPGDSTFKIQDK